MTGKPVRHLSLTETLVLAAVLVGGIFGSALDRSLVATPAWRHLGVVAWADYSRTPIWATATSSTRSAQSCGGDW